MQRRRGRDATEAVGSNSNALVTGERKPTSIPGPKRTSKEAALRWTSLLFVLLNSSWLVYHFQFERLPPPLSAAQAGKRGFSEHRAVEHVKALTRLGPHSVGSDALDQAVQYVLSESQRIKAMAHWDVEVEVDYFHSTPGVNRLVGGLFKGRTLGYGNLKHVIMRITPKYDSEAENNAILVSSHIDTVFSAEGAGDCSSCVAVMLELARGISHWAHGFKHAVVFLFNTGEEEGLDGAHSFVTQHPWNSTIRVAVDLEAMGIGGKSSVFQGGPDPWIVEVFARVATYPSAQIIAQDIFHSGAINSATDFQVYREVVGLSGLDFAYGDNGAVYHTKNDKLELLKPGSLQHLGENMLALLREVATSPHLQNIKPNRTERGAEQMQIIYFDVLGKYMVVYSQKLANLLYISIILQSLLICSASLFHGGVPAIMSLSTACFSVLLMWTISISFSAFVAFLLPHICTSPMPYMVHPWLVVGLFGAPALLGALFGHHLGYIVLQKYLLHLEMKRHERRLGKEGMNKAQLDSIKWETQRWLFKAGFIQWLFILILGTWLNAGSSYIAFIWLVSPAMTYGLMEATLSPMRPPRELRTSSLILGLIIPVVVTAGIFTRLVGIFIGTIIRLDRNPGGSPEWFGNVVISTLVAATVCLVLVYLIPYAHHSGGLKWIMLGTSVIFLLNLLVVVFEVLPPFTKDVGRVVNVVHVVKTAREGGKDSPLESFVSLSSSTPGKLAQEAKNLKDENFVCERGKPLDFVTYSVYYGCVSRSGTKDGWSEKDIPVVQVNSDNTIEGERETILSFDTKLSYRWALAINAIEIKGIKLEMVTSKGKRETLLPEGGISAVHGWHIIQFSSEKDGPTHFFITLSWRQNFTDPMSNTHSDQNKKNDPLIKLRTDVNTITPKVARTLEKLPDWCTLFGKERIVRLRNSEDFACQGLLESTAENEN